MNGRVCKHIETGNNWLSPVGHFTDGIFKYISLNESLRILIIFTNIWSQNNEPAPAVVMTK